VPQKKNWSPFADCSQESNPLDIVDRGVLEANSEQDEPSSFGTNSINLSSPSTTTATTYNIEVKSEHKHCCIQEQYGNMAGDKKWTLS
jgi:hypothetical protein